MLSGGVADDAVLDIPRDILFYGLVGFLGGVARSIAELKDGHLDAFDSEFLALDHAGHVDVEFPPLNLVAGISNYVLARITPRMPDLDARTDGQQRWIGSHNMPVNVLAGGSDAVLSVSRRNVGPIEMRMPAGRTERERSCEK